jgi:hypothetical protein
MKTKKLAVQPISPAAAAALTATPAERPFVPTNWEDAFADLSDRMLRVVGHQQAKIQTLTAELTDARADTAAVTAAAGRAHAELVERFDALVILVEKLTGTVAAVPDSITAAVAPLNDLARVTQMVTALDELATAHAGTLAKLTQRVDDLVDVAEATAAEFTAANAAIAAANDMLAALNKHATATDQIVTAHGETLVEHFDRAIEQGDALVDLRAIVAAGDAAAAVQVERIAELAAQAGALAKLTQRVDDVVQDTSAVKSRVAEHDDALVDLRAVVAAGDAAAAVQVERVDDLAAQAGELRTAVSVVETALDFEKTKLTAAIAKVAGDVDDLSETASGEDAALMERLITVEAKTADHTATVERVGAVENRVIELQRITMDHVQRIDTDGERIERVEDTVTGFVAKIKATADTIAAIDKAVKDGTASIAETTAETADMLRRVNVMLGEMPSAMMVDQDGELVRVARSGELTKLGKVVAHGRDGTNAADIVAVKLDGDRIVFTRSDRTEFGCSIAALIQPAPPAAATPAAPEVDPTTLGYLSKDPATRAVQVADMVAMRAAKKSYKAIAEKYKISERQVVRLIKGHKND